MLEKGNDKDQSDPFKDWLDIIDLCFVVFILLFIPIFDIMGLPPIFWVVFIVFPMLLARVALRWLWA